MKKFRYTLISLLLILGILLPGSSLFAQASEAWVLFGDVDFDGFVSAADARLVLRQAGRIDAPFASASYEFRASDVDRDGKITALDARAILRDSANLEKIAQDPSPYGDMSVSEIAGDMTALAQAVKDNTIGFEKTEISSFDNVQIRTSGAFSVIMSSQEIEQTRRELLDAAGEVEKSFSSGNTATWNGMTVYQREFPLEYTKNASNFDPSFIKAANATPLGNTLVYNVALKDETLKNINNNTDTMVTNHSKVFDMRGLDSVVRSINFNEILELDIAGIYPEIPTFDLNFKDSSVRYEMERDQDGKIYLTAANYRLRWSIKLVLKVYGEEYWFFGWRRPELASLTMEISSIMEENFKFNEPVPISNS